jgi:hypothetical protein
MHNMGHIANRGIAHKLLIAMQREEVNPRIKMLFGDIARCAGNLPTVLKQLGGQPLGSVANT